jgi:hypothetical protein
MMSVLPICVPGFYTGRGKHAKKIFFVKSRIERAIAINSPSPRWGEGRGEVLFEPLLVAP